MRARSAARSPTISCNAAGIASPPLSHDGRGVRARAAAARARPARRRGGHRNAPAAAGRRVRREDRRARRRADHLAGHRDPASARRRAARARACDPRRLRLRDLRIGNAVEFGARSAGAWPAKLVTFAPGPGTAEALAAVGIANARVPTKSWDSEGLLELPELQDVSGKRIVIFRGEGGREFLGNSLRARGGSVDHVTCYRRVAPQTGADGLVEAMRDGRASALTLTSAEGLDNLVAALGPAGCALLAKLPVFAAHPRIAERVREHGLSAVECAGGDAGLLAGLLEWFGARRAHESHTGAP